MLQSVGSQRVDMTEHLNNNNKGFKSSQGASQVVLVVKESACQCRRHKRCGLGEPEGRSVKTDVRR